MKGIMIFFIIVGVMSLVGMLYNIVAYQRPGIYPPKRVIKQRALALGGVGFALFLIGILLSLVVK